MTKIKPINLQTNEIAFINKKIIGFSNFEEYLKLQNKINELIESVNNLNKQEKKK